MKKLMLLFAIFSILGLQIYAQNTVTGTVTDDAGETLPGVSVLVKGTTVGTMTLADGSYTIEVPDGSNTLVFSYIGMETQEAAISGDVIDVTMMPSSEDIGEVVVTALGISKEKKALGYTVQEVSGEDMTRTANTDMINALNAKTAGVNITSSGGTAGSSAFITIRGSSSIKGNNQPLFIVDGMPVETQQNWGGSEYETEGVNSSSRSIDFNPEDIETVSVLKGGAATALYGVQAANGVIIITTKKGTKNQKMKISYHGSATMSQISQHIELQDVYSQGLNDQWISGYSGSWGAKVDTLAYSTHESVWLNPDYNVNGALVSQNDPLANGGPAQTFDAYGFFQNAWSFNNNLSIQAGNANTSYYFSLGNLDEKGIIPNNTFNRTSLRLNAETKLTDKITTGGNTMFSHSVGNFIQNGSNVSGIMLGLARMPQTFDASAGWKLEDGTQRTYRHGGGYNNPYWSANENYFEDKNDRFVGSAFVKADLLDWLNLSYNVGTDWYSRRFQDVFAVNDRTYPDGKLEERGEFNQSFNSTILLNMNRDLTDDIGLTVIAGQNLYSTSFKMVSTATADLAIPGLYHIDNTSAQSSDKYEVNYRTSAVFLNLDLDFYNMLYLGATVRNEWSTTMPEDKLSALYPSFSLGFVFTELAALKGNSILSFGKLRGSWAKTANIAPPYYTRSVYNSTSVNDGWTGGIDFPFRDVSGYEVGWLLGNSELVHEDMTTFEVGAELKFLKDKIGLDFSYFQNTNNNLILPVPIATSSGYNNMSANAASMESKGFEISAYATVVKTKDFEWNIRANFTKMENEVLELAEGVDNVFLGGFTDPQVRAVVGYDYGTIFGYDWWRDADGNILINDDPTDANPDGFPWTCDTAQVALGSVSPDWTANVSTTVNYKGIGLYALLDIRQGGLMYNGTRFTLNFFGQTMETLNRDVVYNDNGTINYDETPAENIVVFDGVYGHLGEDADGNTIVVSDGTTNTTRVVQDQAWYRGHGGNFGGGPTAAAIEDASWVRLREVALSYTLNKSVLENTFFNGVEIYVSGKNLWLATPYQGIDPETSLTQARNSQGFDYFNNPGTKSYTFGVKLTF
ncbi:MAG: SusC/RagA family TonB-linked outer membrane protein [Bacteroidales bacterium]|nr:SusC/RagA family TonB-linked outer membrane protein [Bacteroidales bacterium]